MAQRRVREGSCGFPASAVDALTTARIEWRPICQAGSLEPLFATLEADMSVAPFLSRTIPDRLVRLGEVGLPALPIFHIKLRLPTTGVSAVAKELAQHVREGFRRRYS